MALAVTFGAAGPARALDLTGDASNRDATPAYTENNRMGIPRGRSGAESIGLRPGAEYTPEGVRSGYYTFYPSIGTNVVFDDNVFATNAIRRSDVRIEVLPSVRVVSDLPRHVLDFAVDAKLASYTHYRELDANDVSAKANAVLHFDHAHTLSINLLTGIEHVNRLTTDAPDAPSELTPVWHNRASVGLRRDAGRLYGKVGVVAETWDYRAVKAWDGSTLAQDSNDMKIFSTYGMLGYRFSPGFEWQGKVRALRQINRGDASQDMSAYGYEALTGLAFETGPLLHWSLLGGYGIRDWDRAGQATSGAGLVQGSVKWFVLPSVVATLAATRSFSEGISSDDRNTNSVDTTIQAKIEYEMWRNLLFTLGGEYRLSDIIGEDRRDRSYTGRVGFDYYLNKNWQLSFAYEHTERMSTDPTFDLTRNKVTIGATLKF